MSWNGKPPMQLAALLDGAGPGGMLRVGPILIQWGTVTVTFSATTFATATITYDQPFSATPGVFPVPQGTSGLFDYLPGTPGTLSCSVGLRSYDSSSVTGSFVVPWFAIGPA